MQHNHSSIIRREPHFSSQLAHFAYHLGILVLLGAVFCLFIYAMLRLSGRAGRKNQNNSPFSNRAERRWERRSNKRKQR